jgi:AmiR/NasT family two-component response regulator
MLDDLNDRRRKRAHVLRAVVRLVQREALDGDAAYARLRREAMRARLSIETYCQLLLEAGDDQDPDENQQRRKPSAPIPTWSER